ncbi:MAG: hypothetical protein RLZZ123_1238 [Pseudomonadota bacterium]
MNIFALGRQDTFRLLLECIPVSSQIEVAVAWARSGHPIDQALRQNPSNVMAYVVGTSFNHTSAELLDHWRNHTGFRRHPPFHGGVFHPKVYLLKGQTWGLAVMGSCNMTQGGLSDHAVGNVERSMVYFEGRPDPKCSLLNELTQQYPIPALTLEDSGMHSTFFQHLEAQMKHDFEQASLVTPGFIDGYKKLQNSRRAQPEEINLALMALEKQSEAGLQAATGTLSFADWSEIKGRTVLACAQRSGPDCDEWGQRLDILRLAHEQWVRDRHLKVMPAEFRLALAGVIKNPKLPGMGGLDWHLFSHVVGAHLPVYEALRTQQTTPGLEALSSAYDEIPLFKPVTQAHYDRFLSIYLPLIGHPKNPGMVAPTRMLALKRPDVFLPISRKTKVQLANELGMPQHLITLQTYWTRVVEPLRQMPWNQTPPESLRFADEPPWQARMALLDALFYGD